MTKERARKREKNLDLIRRTTLLSSLEETIQMPEHLSNPRPRQGIIRSGESATGGPIHFIGKDTWVKLAGGDQPGSITVIEDVTPPRDGPPLHAHAFEEWFYILEGNFLFELAGMPFSVGVGDFVHAPSNEPHVFQNTSDKDARMLVIAKPGGVENYFTELAERAMNDPANVAALSEIGARYGVTLLGPPIAARR
jgi:quercetin dioxygenase-like cupin family protein